MTTSQLSADFTHLEVHSYFTLLGATGSVKDLVNRAVEDGMNHLALTDTNALYGVVTFEKACRAAGIEPIPGMAVNVAPEPDMATADVEKPGRLVLLATGPEGYRSLCRLSSLIQTSPEREALAARGLLLSDLAVHCEGLVCLSGGRSGWVERLLRAGDEVSARVYAEKLAAMYGDRTYLCLELHQPQDRVLAQAITHIGRQLGLPYVAVQPVFCLEKKERPRLRLLAAIKHNCKLDEVPSTALPALGETAVDVHWLGKHELAQRFAEFPEAISTIGEITGLCGPALPDGRLIWPVLKLPAGSTPDRALADLARQGAGELYSSPLRPEVGQRLEDELSAIGRHGYAPLFLVVADIVRFARFSEIPVSTRGSVANSLVAYCAGITNVDPITHGLIFERFLSPAREDAPDIDLDFCTRRRDLVLDYVRRTHGVDRVAIVGTISTLRSRSAVRETAKAYGLSKADIRKMTSLLPHFHHPDPRRRARQSIEDMVAGLDDLRLKEILLLALNLVGQPDHLSVHPGGVVITPGPLTDVIPTQLAPKGFVITQVSHQDVEALGLPKIDLLGISALTVMADAADLIREGPEPTFRTQDIPLDDPTTENLLKNADTIGIFQCESEGARRTIRKLQAQSVTDLAAANAFFKPGPSLGGMARSFVRRYRGQEKVTYLHPALIPILESTKGVLLYQEQIIRIAREIAGLSWEQADHLRRGMSKFQPTEMVMMREQFVAGCCRSSPDGPGFSPKQAQTMWDQVAAFTGYGINKGHATAYAAVSYRLAFIKAHWPAEFMSARLANQGGFHTQAIYIAEANRLGIDVRPPHVNFSQAVFSLKPGTNTLWMGLDQVRDIRQSSIQAIQSERSKRPFSGLRDLLTRVDLLNKEIHHLIQCGALDDLGESRAALLAEAADLERHDSPQQLALPFSRPTIQPEPPAQRLEWEWFLLGQPISVHPISLVKDRLPEFTPLDEVTNQLGRPVTTTGVRLPGWTGSQGFYLGDASTYVLAKGDKSFKNPPSWQPLLVNGRWLMDEFGNGWFQIEETRPVAAGG